MKSIRIENLKSIKDSNEIYLKQLNILLGKNSVGKSSFLKSFVLLQQSLINRVDSPLLWHHEMGVDFGSFDDTVIHNECDFISFTFKFDPIVINQLINNESISSERGNSQVKISIKKINNYVDNRLNKFELMLYDNTIMCEINKDKTIDKIIINDLNIYECFKDIKLKIGDCYYDNLDNQRNIGIIPFIHTEKENDINQNNNDIYINNLLKYYSIETFINKIFSNLKNIYPKDVINYIFNQFNDLKFVNILNNIDEKIFKSLLLLFNINEIINKVNTEIFNIFKNVYYIGSYRFKVERFYKIHQIENLKSDNYRNLPSYLFYLEKNDKIRELNKYLRENFNIEIKLKEENDIVEIKVREINKYDNFYVNISDLGLGLIQLLPILIILWDVSTNEDNSDKIILIEQPELNLHSTMQIEFIDNIMKILDRNKNIKFIIETHSEKIINRLGVCVEMNEIKPENINLLIFNQDNAITKIYQTVFNNRGGIKGWHEGFFQS